MEMNSIMNTKESKTAKAIGPLKSIDRILGFVSAFWIPDLDQ